MGLTQSLEDKDIIFEVLDGVFGRGDIRPIDEFACYNEDGSFNARKFEAFLDRESDESSARMNVLFLLLELLTEARAKAALDLRAEAEPPHTKTRVRQVKTFSDPSTGVAVSMTARHILWWILYIQQPKIDCPQWKKVFRKQFQLPCQSFLVLLAIVRDKKHCDFFERW